jgi:hypothetical protein
MAASKGDVARARLRGDHRVRLHSNETLGECHGDQVEAVEGQAVQNRLDPVGAGGLHRGVPAGDVCDSVWFGPSGCHIALVGTIIDHFDHGS